MDNTTQKLQFLGAVAELMLEVENITVGLMTLGIVSEGHDGWFETSVNALRNIATSGRSEFADDIIECAQGAAGSTIPAGARVKLIELAEQVKARDGFKITKTND